MKIGSNENCPCLSGKKYKKCCRGRVDWPTLGARPWYEVAPYLSARGKNIFFVQEILGALQLDTVKGPVPMERFKAAFTPAAVRQIFEAVQTLWPSGEDLQRVLRTEASATSGLYIGHYDTERILRGVTRHSLYADRILLVDPFPHPATIQERFNPLAHPEMHRSTTLRWVHLWLSLFPWINADIIHFVRTPGDFNSRLLFETVEIGRRRQAAHPELQDLGNDPDARELMETIMKRELLYSVPDEEYRRFAREEHPDWPPEKVDEAIAYLRQERAEDPFYLKPLPGAEKSEIVQFSTGASYEMAKVTAMDSGSYLLTDIPTRWREIELDRQEARVDDSDWEPFAKALQAAPFSYLNNITLDAALTLRQEGRLEDMRAFLRRVWREAARDAPYAVANASNLASELTQHVREAEAEWSKIDRELVKWFGTAVAGAVASGPVIGHGAADWAPWATIAAGGVLSLYNSTRKRAEFKMRYPAGFFLKLGKGLA